MEAKYIVKRLHAGSETVINPAATLAEANQALRDAYNQYIKLYGEVFIESSFDPANAFVDVTYHDDITGFYAV